MSNFTRFNHKSLINPNYQDSEQYIPLKDIPFKKSAELYAAYPEMTYFIKAMYRSTSDYGDQIVAIIKPEYANRPEENTEIPIKLNNGKTVYTKPNGVSFEIDGKTVYGDRNTVFRMALPRKYTEIINPDDAGLIDDCNKGLAKFRITQYHSKRFNKELNDIQFL